MTTLDAKISSSTDSPCPDSSPFLNWSEDEDESESQTAVVFRSLVATLKLQPALDDNLEEKAVRLLESVTSCAQSSADAFLCRLSSPSDESLTDFIQSIVVLISSPSQNITTAAMMMLNDLVFLCSPQVHLTLVKADLIPQLVTYLKPLSLSLTKAVNISRNLISCIRWLTWIATPGGLEDLEIEAPDEQQAIHETALQQVVVPSEKYIWHLCVNRFSIIDGDQSDNFLELLAKLIEISPYYQPTMDFILHMPIFLTVPSCLTFFKNDRSIYDFLYEMVDAQREWNETRREVRQMGKKADRMLRMEGIEDVIEERLRNNQNTNVGEWINFGRNRPAPAIRSNSFRLVCRNDWDSLSQVSLDGRRTFHLLRRRSRTSKDDSEGSKGVPHPHSPLPLHSPPHPPTPLCLSLTTHTLPLPSASPSPRTPSHSPLTLPHHPHPPTPLCLSLTIHTLPLPSASPSPPTLSHSLCVSLTTHTLPLPSAYPSPPTPSHSPLPLPHHPHPPTPLCLSLTTHTLPLLSASSSPPTPSHSPLPIPSPLFVANAGGSHPASHHRSPSISSDECTAIRLMTT
ncbi:hypothetical protein BLNAU_9272 [Blattamonas nauphoetae]|uniref:Uncharacterized protein n=1 Tax=Blattamonas nauphoetae TaxID=2049346 RepID=A0ABQ9XW82_9EUKA|nr:hypothetical protein BLNAU_9272 [Blattamonas nauphoetae]